jgi:hypothetical protein
MRSTTSSSGARIFVDDARGVAAEFQRDLLAARARLEIPADQAAGEAQQRDAFVLDQQAGVFVGAGQDRERALRQVGFRQHLRR